MPIHFARCRFIQRSAQNSVAKVAAYNARTAIVDERTGERHDAIRWRADLERHAIILPDGASPRLRDLTFLVDTAETAERRKDARVGRDFILALPHELDSQDRFDLARSFVIEHWVSKGLVAQLDIHRPHEGTTNWHAHVWITMRRVEGDGFAKTQAADLLPTLRTSSYGTFVAEADRWGQLWTLHQERFFYDKKLDLHVDPTAIFPEKRSYGPRRAWGRDPEHSRAAQLIAELRARNHEAARNPELVLMFAKQQMFDGQQLRRFLEKNIPNQTEREGVTEYIDTRGGSKMSETIESATLYNRYTTERENAADVRKHAEQAIYDRFSSYRTELRDFYTVQHEQQKLEVLRGRERYKEHEILRAEERGERLTAQQLQSQQLAAARQEHPLLSWNQFLRRESERGDREASRILQQRQAREQQLAR